MKEMTTVLLKWAKEDPKDFVASILFIGFLFGFAYCSIWLDAIISGRV